MNWRAPLLAGLVLASTFSQPAQAATMPTGGGLPIPGRVATDAMSYSDGEILSMFGPSKPGKAFSTQARRALRGGARFAKANVAYFVASSLLSAAINFAVGSESEYPVLTNWWKGSNYGGTLILPPGNEIPFEWLEISTKPDANSFRVNNFMDRHSYEGRICGQTLTTMGPVSYGELVQAVATYQARINACTEETLAQYASHTPSISNEVARAVGRYIQANPSAVRPAVSVTVTTAAGTSERPPTTNEWDDNPYSSLTDDGDGDGVPDYLEYEDMLSGGQGDMENPAQQPVGAPYEIGRETQTERTPNGTRTTTTVRYSNGKTATTVVERRVTVTPNPSGGTSTTVTTTTTTTGVNGETSSRTHTETRTGPATSPGPDPDPLGDHDGDGVPNSEDPDRQAQREEEAMRRQEEKREACQGAGRVFDDVNGTCGGSQEERDEQQREKEAAKERAEKAKSCRANGDIWNSNTETCQPSPEKEEEKRKEKCTAADRVWDSTTGTCGGSREEEEEKQREKEKAKNCKEGGDTWNSSTSTCEPSKEKQEEAKQKACEDAEREWDSVNKTCGGEKKKDDDEVSNDCGDFSVKRLIAYTGQYLKDVIFPCEEPQEIFKPVTELLKTKFPFSLAASLNGWFDSAGGSDGGGSEMPSNIGIIPLDWGWLAGLWSTIKTLVGVALWAWFIYWLIDRFTPRTQI